MECTRCRCHLVLPWANTGISSGETPTLSYRRWRPGGFRWPRRPCFAGRLLTPKMTISRLAGGRCRHRYGLLRSLEIVSPLGILALSISCTFVCSAWWRVRVGFGLYCGGGGGRGPRCVMRGVGVERYLGWEGDVDRASRNTRAFQRIS